MAFHSLLWRCVAKRLTRLFGSHCNCSSKGRMYKLQKQERLLNAVEMGDIYEVQTCLDSGAGINDVPWGTESLLMRAIRCKHKEVAKFLINKGIDVNYVYVKSDSPRSETKNFRQETAREYAEFYDMPEIIELIDARRIRLQATP